MAGVAVQAAATAVPVESRGDEAEPVEEPVAAATSPATDEGGAAPDESAEAAFLAEARARGETFTPAAAAPVEETNGKNLPPLDELVGKIPADVRETLDELFRARFVTVKRFPASALKS